MINLSISDNEQLSKRGISPEMVEGQIQQLIKGFPFVHLHSAATLDYGIMEMDETKAQQFSNSFEENKKTVVLSKFVPASGAASRMFKHLFNYLEVFETNPGKAQQLLVDNSFGSVSYFLEHIQTFAFYPDLSNIFANNGFDLEQFLEEKKYDIVIQFLLTEKGLNYANLPKGLLLFHKSTPLPRTAIEEHLAEGACHAKNSNGDVNIHFTVSPEHEEEFVKLIDARKSFYENKFGITYHISFSMQKPSTDTVAIDDSNDIFREKDGSIHFRPGGHGALIENLNDLKGDIIFIKNIDNITSDNLRPTTCLYKKAMAGLLLEIREKQHYFLQLLEKNIISEEKLNEIIDFIKIRINTPLPSKFDELALEEKQKMLHDILYRPLRICGMVKNVGEPGGGPFYVEYKNEVSLQIVESSQIDLSEPKQKEIFDSSTHFNPVDLVCSVRDHNGELFDLRQYTNPETGFISNKSKDGRNLKALELPGLWNGAMDKWITLFIETPLITFNPVKTINDLLRDTHL